MILQALVRYYEDLLKAGKVGEQGWSTGKVSFAIHLRDDGSILQISDIRQPNDKGKLLPVLMNIPSQAKRSSGIVPNLLCDNSAYLLGSDAKGNPKRALDCFTACKKLHLELFGSVSHPAAKALCGFFTSWSPERIPETEVLQEYWDDIIAGANLVFRYDGQYMQDIPEIRAVLRQNSNSGEDAAVMACSVTGEIAPVAVLHPGFTGVAGAQSSGASIVSFNAPAFCSYGHDGDQGLNAPTSQYAAFAYGEALKYLLADRSNVYRIGDATVVCWAEGADETYQSFLGYSLFGKESPYSTKELSDKLKALVRGQPVTVNESRLDPDKPFYVLALSPNAARLSVRFFLRNSFGQFAKNIDQHHERMEIIKPSFDKFETLSLRSMLNETVNENAKDKAPSPKTSGETLRAILMNTRYPATLLNGVVLRIRAEHEITRGRAAIIKAYYLKNPHPDFPKEVLTVSLNEDSTNYAYNLGRLFSVLEQIQDAANPNINTTITDKYFTSASATPGIVFPVLINLAQNHLRKLDDGKRIYLSKLLGSIMDNLGESYPSRMNLPQQGSFQLGYYHQKQARYIKKEEN